MGKYDLFKNESIVLIGERYPNRIAWLQLYDASDFFDEEDIRGLLISISQHILKGRIQSESARKFLDGKLIFFEPASLRQTSGVNRIYVIFTREMEIYSTEKKAIKAVALRGGVYSASRFFSEIIDLLESPEKMEMYEKLTTKEAIKKIDNFDFEGIDINEMGYMITQVDRSKELDQVTLERIYFHLYQILDDLEREIDTHQDPDEFLDATYIVAQRYLETNNFHLALELFKKIIPIARRNKRYDLEVACRIDISTIYKNYFPDSGVHIIAILEPLKEIHLKEANNKHLEIYHCLKGHSYAETEKTDKALKEFNKAISLAEQEINAPSWIADAYNYLGMREEERLFLKDAVRHYLTAATIAFSAGDLSIADHYRNNAAKSEVHISNSIMHTALIHFMEGDDKDAEYRAWESLRVLVKAYAHCMATDLYHLERLSEDIIYYGNIVLDIPGKKRKNKKVIRKIEKLTQTLQQQLILPATQQELIDDVSKEIEENIPLPPPIFMLLSLDGRLMTMGKITDSGWEKSDIEGTLLSGILAAIMSLVAEVSDETSSLRTVDAGNTQIMIEQTENVVAVLLVDRDIQEFRLRLINLLHYVDETIGQNLIYWDGNISIFEEVKEMAIKSLAPSVVAANIDEYK